MFDEMDDVAFERHVRLVCHTMAYRRYLRDQPQASRADAWQHAALNWEEFIDAALEFLAIQVLHRESQRQTGHPAA